MYREKTNTKAQKLKVWALEASPLQLIFRDGCSGPTHRFLNQRAKVRKEDLDKRNEN